MRLPAFTPDQKRQTLIFIPFFFTFANAALGLLSILNALDAEFVTAAYCILLAAFMDSLDGRLARAFGITSSLGMELDSLCDAISFCLAPAVLLYSFSLHEFGILGICVLVLYLCAGLFRLARFNSTDQNQDGSYFFGLPTPMAAFVVTSLVIYHDWLSESYLYFVLKKYWLIGLIGVLAILMVSSILFPSFKKPKRAHITLYLKSIPLALICALAALRGVPIPGTLLMMYLVVSLIAAFGRAYRRYAARTKKQIS